ncbi:YlxQ family RNA-binding protein [Companilactobacillus sp. RD055328]|uniref:L7Ae/L30e/S12e/Gadd45 family ribosomal protein n=1 Tax=Companilactobacillus sp. RD055328 TaxID=2916634 RepID=UPI001FC895A8|nr:ribosomal L7Ae/L30e/S12e/Gadd45 family protein [Companilactobacillus sp. RD055328]GKQ42614.1 YlxQ family RNA-binding protein [Companilactobacillus sp. RD055328]
MNKQQVINFLGIATRAKKTITGTELVGNAIASGKTRLVLVSKDISERSLKDITNKTNYYQVKMYQVLDDEEIEQATGKSRKMIAIVDNGMAKKFDELIN